MDVNEKLGDEYKNVTNLRIKCKKLYKQHLVLHARLGLSREKIEEFPDFLFRVEFVRKNLLKKTEERMWSSKVSLKESLMYFNDETINL
jgi:hypothetical protein